jgi:hypothetical protein
MTSEEDIISNSEKWSKVGKEGGFFPLTDLSGIRAEKDGNILQTDLRCFPTMRIKEGVEMRGAVVSRSIQKLVKNMEGKRKDNQRTPKLGRVSIY